MLTGTGSVELAVPRDGEGRFEPQLIEKWARRLPGFDEKVISLYARGMTTREIRAQVEELCGVTVSRELISKVTGEVHEELREWRSRPLEAVYPIVYFDALRVKVREEGVVQNQAVHLATGVTALGRKEILGMWTAAQEGASGGAKFWLGVMNELKARGVRDVLIAVVDGLKGFPEAIEYRIRAAFPEATVQTCLVHLIRYSLAHASWKERKELAGALRPIYRADTLEEAEEALDGFEAGSWGRKFPAIARSWRRNWAQVIPFFAFSKPIRRVIYTTNAIKSLNSTVRSAVRTRGHFPNDRAAMKLIYLTLRKIERKVERKWQGPQAFWSQAPAGSRLCSATGSRWRLCEPAARRPLQSGRQSSWQPLTGRLARRLEPVESAVPGKSRRPWRRDRDGPLRPERFPQDLGNAGAFPTLPTGSPRSRSTNPGKPKPTQFPRSPSYTPNS